MQRGLRRGGVCETHIRDRSVRDVGGEMQRELRRGGRARHTFGIGAGMVVLVGVDARASGRQREGKRGDRVLLGV